MTLNIEHDFISIQKGLVAFLMLSVDCSMKNCKWEHSLQGLGQSVRRVLTSRLAVAGVEEEGAILGVC
jgi:hypothetical protein